MTEDVSTEGVPGSRLVDFSLQNTQGSPQQLRQYTPPGCPMESFAVPVDSTVTPADPVECSVVAALIEKVPLLSLSNKATPVQRTH